MTARDESPAVAPTKALTRRVAEALARDVGRGLARFDPEDMKTLGTEVGDIVQLQGKRQTVAKVMPAHQEARGKGIVQIDGLTRANAQVGLDERVAVTMVSARPAVRLTLVPSSLMRTTERERDTRYLARSSRPPVLTGDRPLFGATAQEFTVQGTVLTACHCPGHVRPACVPGRGPQRPALS